MMETIDEFRLCYNTVDAIMITFSFDKTLVGVPSNYCGCVSNCTLDSDEDNYPYWLEVQENTTYTDINDFPSVVCGEYGDLDWISYRDYYANIMLICM